MLVEVALQSKRLAAPSAYVWFLCRVSLHMRPKVGLVGKTFSAFWAIEWFFTCMGSDVTLKMKKNSLKK